MTTTSTGGPATSRGAARIDRRDLRSIAVFLVLAFGLAWLVALPVWLGDGIADPAFTPTALLMMTTPAIAAVLVVFFVERPARRARALGLWPLRPIGTVSGWAATGIAVSMAMVLVALPVGALLGVYPADFAGLSGFRRTLEEQVGPGAVSGSVGLLAVLQIALVPLAAVVGVLPALGEEIGWRGWLLPKLMPLGAVPAILVSGVVWGTWHAPVLLLGYNYPGTPGWLAVASMTAMCVLVGAVLGWVRLRSGSVWPAALGHSAFNATAGSFLLFAQAGATVDTTQATILGWSGWIVPLVLVVVIVATGRFAPRAGSDQPTPERVPAA